MNQRPTRVRYLVLAFACGLSMITYLDRACFGKAASTLVSELSLSSEAELKWALTAFTIAYAIFEIPSGWLGDAWGPRRTLLRIVLWWSVCTALTGVVGLSVGSTILRGIGALVFLRFLFGMGEAGAYPNITRALHNWFPADQTGAAQGWVWMSGRLMGGLTPVLWTLLVMGTQWTHPIVSWRGAFALFGIVGVVWCAAFAWFFRDHPRDHSWVNAEERREIEQSREAREAPRTSLPARAFLRSKSLWLLCLMYFCMVYGWYFNITYLPAYLESRFDLDPKSILGAIYEGGPMWIGAASCLAGGLLVDWLIRRTGDWNRSRRMVGITSQVLCAIGWIAAIFASNVHTFFLAVSLAAFCNDMTLASAWAACQDIGQRYTAVTAACMNTVGTLGAALAAWLTGTIVQLARSSHASALAIPVNQLAQTDKHAAEMMGYKYTFATFAAAYFVSAICWRFIDSTKPIVASPQHELIA
jgi:MFS family permease